MSDRTFDIVVYGATGFVGRWIAEYIVERHPGLKWAIAGRSQSKLDALNTHLAAEFPAQIEACGPIPTVLADSSDPESLASMAVSTRVVLSTVGPYAKYGAPLVAACVKQRTHYCDLTGEPQFVKRMIDAHHADAVENDVRIVHCCGFDSVPSDMGTFALQQAAIERHGQPASRVDMVLKVGKGGFSGGTFASLLNVMEEIDDPYVRRAVTDPYSLAPGGGPDTGELERARYDDVLGGWTGPFFMAAINERIVRRSNWLLDHRYGTGFAYQESMWTGRGAKGRIAASAIAGGFGLGKGALVFAPVRALAKKGMPAPGEGPSDDDVRNGFFVSELHGDVDGQTLRVTVKGERDPGYGATAAMITEAALTLANDDLGPPGVSTPAAALGLPYLDRLNASPLMSVTVHD
jgi:short subunit dehydrogenase-like uncharacterized protein